MDGRSTRRRGRRVGGRKKRGTKPPSLRSDKRSLRKRLSFELLRATTAASFSFERIRRERVSRDRRSSPDHHHHPFLLSLSPPRRDRTDGSIVSAVRGCSFLAKIMRRGVILRVQFFSMR